MPKNTKGIIGIVVIIILLLAGIAAIVYFYFFGVDKSSSDPFISNIQKTLNITPAPNSPPGQRLSGPEVFPFEDLTIPYLRSRNYESELGELTKVSENSQYTSYITSYDSEGYKINGLLTIPTSDMPSEGFPVVIFVHGYIPPTEYKTLVNYVSYVDYLADRGLVVFKIDLRGHDESEGEAGGAYYSGDYVIDTLNAVAAIKKLNDLSKVNSFKSIVDPNRISLWGHSMAGNIVFRSFIANPEIKKVVIWAGAGYTYSDLQDYMIQDNSYRPPPANTERARKRAELRNLYGDFNPESEFWRKVPATNYLDGKEGDVQIHHAVDDNVVSIEYSQNLINILDSTDIGHELFEYQSGGHNLVGSAFNQAMQRSVEFFTR